MPTRLTIPRLEMAMTEGSLAEWLVTDGTQVKEGDPIYVLETGKAAQEILAPASGRLVQTGKAGETYPVGTDIGEITYSVRDRESADASLSSSVSSRGHFIDVHHDSGCRSTQSAPPLTNCSHKFRIIARERIDSRAHCVARQQSVGRRAQQAARLGGSPVEPGLTVPSAENRRHLPRPRLN